MKQPYYRSENVTLYCADWSDAAAQMEWNSVDCIVTDPPYESLNKWREIGTTARLGGHRDPDKRDEAKWFQTISNDDLPDLLQYCMLLLKPNTHCYVMCDFDTMPYMLQYGVVEGVFQHCAQLIWDKCAPGMGYHYRRQYESIMMFDKGKNRRLNDLSVSDVLRFPMVNGKSKLYPTQKPVELFQQLIRQSTAPGEVVFDPFLGSGTCAVAALREGRRCVGIDIDKEACAIAEKRIREEEAKLQLPFDTLEEAFS